MDFAKKIDEFWSNKPQDKARVYIGASSIGNPCDAYLALSLRGFPQAAPKPSTQRIFRDGHRIEDVVIADMVDAGIDVVSRDPATGKQFEFSLYGGHVQAHADGVIRPEHLLEIKSMNNEKFESFVNDGVQLSHPMYFSQMQFLMGASGKWKRCVLAAYNKNNSTYHFEEVKFNRFLYSSLIARAERAMRNEARRISASPDTMACRMCFKKESCWNGADERNCRTCNLALPTDDRKWYCTLHDITVEAEHVCNDYIQYRPLEKL
jgi:hypothetical protein